MSPPPYPYPEANSSLISSLRLESHFEGGFFAQTELSSQKVASPLAGGAERPLATQIYYLLSPASPWGRMHRNLSETYHVHHAGRSEYTLLYPPTADTPARVEHVVMGSDAARGEVKQLFVGTNVWKASRLPKADLAQAGSGEVDPERVGCLISEVVTPGWVADDHEFLDFDRLVEIFGGDVAKAEMLRAEVTPLDERKGE